MSEPGKACLTCPEISSCLGGQAVKHILTVKNEPIPKHFLGRLSFRFMGATLALTIIAESQGLSPDEVDEFICAAFEEALRVEQEERGYFNEWMADLKANIDGMVVLVDSGDP